MLKNISTSIATSLFIHIIIFHNITSSLVYDCNPKERCRRASVGINVPDPEDCHSYYICLEDPLGHVIPSDSPMKCQDGLYFDAQIKYCVLGSCINQCVNLCKSECTDYNFEKVADLRDCSSYYTCLPGGHKAHSKCPNKKPYFDGSECSKETYACCDFCDECTSFITTRAINQGCDGCDECTPYCERQFYEIADPYDCRSYYLCLSDIGIASNDNRYTCREGEYFNGSVGRCKPEYEWNPPCKSICPK